MDHMGVEDSGSNTHNRLLIQNCPFQVALFPELSCHQQSDLGGTQSTHPVESSVWSEIVLRTCKRLCAFRLLRPGPPWEPHHLGLTHSEHSGTSRHATAGPAPEQGGCPQHCLQTSASIPDIGLLLSAVPQSTDRKSGPNDS